jgi:DNA repair exonuclease SbcCD ATPase subunit
MIKKVNFEKLSIRNFLSVGSDPVIIDFKTGINIITGSNKDQLDRRNGIGKSTITDAFSFVLFGNTLRDLKKEFIVNNITNSVAEVVLNFSVLTGQNKKNYELFRSIDPSKCFLYEDGIDITRDSMVNTTDYVQTLINVTPEVFQNCIVMAINNTIPFMAKKKIEKRKFIESIFNLEVFSRMNSSLKEQYNEIKREFDINNGKYDELTILLTKLQTQKNNQITQRDQHKNSLLKRQQECLNQKQEYVEKLDKIKDIDLREVKQKIDELKEKEKTVVEEINVNVKRVGSLETKNDLLYTQYSKVGTEKDECPMCLRTITGDDKAHINKRKRDLKREIDENATLIKTEESNLGALELKKQKIVEGIKKLELIVNKQKLAIQQKDHIKSNITELESRLKQIASDIDSVVTVDDSLDGLINDTENKKKDFEEQISGKRNLLNTLDTVKFVISEEGVKSFIVKKILKLFNSKLGYFLRKLNSNAIITFNEYFEETIVNEKGKLTCYDNYSGAEKKVIDLAIMFTFLDMLKLQGNVHYNVQLYDELLDTSLDETGVEMVVNVLNEFVQEGDLGIYIISHRKECAKISSNDIVYLEKKNGITKRIPVKVE